MLGFCLWTYRQEEESEGSDDDIRVVVSMIK